MKLVQCEATNCDNKECEHRVPHTPRQLWGKNGYQKCTSNSICGDIEYANVKCVNVKS